MFGIDKKYYFVVIPFLGFIITIFSIVVVQNLIFTEKEIQYNMHNSIPTFVLGEDGNTALLKPVSKGIFMVYELNINMSNYHQEIIDSCRNNSPDIMKLRLNLGTYRAVEFDNLNEGTVQGGFYEINYFCDPILKILVV